MPHQIIDLTNQKFNQWTVLNRGPNSSTRQARWLCRCNCGRTQLVQSCHLKNGSSTRCKGCSKFQGHGQISLSYWNKIIIDAAKRKYDVAVTIEEAWSKFLGQEQKCALTGQRLVFARNYQTDLQTASLDRIDSSQGYVIGNIQWVHKDINMFKGSLTEDRFIELCKLVTTYQSHSNESISNAGH